MASGRPWRRWGGPALLLGLGALLGGCSGTPFGEQLSGSFSTPPASPPTPATGAQLGSPPGARPGGTGTTPTGSPAVRSTGALPSLAKPPPAPVLAPAPYRITIKLSGADPAAPAEAVTEALRAAGVPFEVEMIERVPTGSSPASAATTAPAPAPAPATPAPGSPAPTPR